MEANKYTISASKTGYIDYEQNVDVKSNNTEDISMIKLVVNSPTMSDFSLNKDTIAIGENVSFSGKIDGNGGIIEKVTINIQGPDNKTLAGLYISKSTNSSTFNLSNIPSFKSGATWMNKPGKYWVEVWAKNKDGVGIKVGEKEVEAIKIINVSGVVISKYTKKPLEGVTITLSNLTATTGEDGKFTFEKVAASSHIVTAKKEGYSLIDENGNTIEKINKYFEETNNQFELYMAAKTGYSITGYVRTSNGEAIPGVEVKPFAPDVKYDSFAVKTDLNGKFIIPEVSTGGHLIVASKEGYASEKDSYNVQIPSTSEVNIVMNELTKVYGIVYVGNYFDDTKQNNLVLNGAAVWLNSKTPEEAGKYVGRTNASGKYNIAGIAPATHIVHAQYYGYKEKNLNMQFSAKNVPVPYDIIMIPEKNIPSEWAKQFVTNAYNNGLITEKTMYDFRGQVSRLEFCELAVKLYEKLKGAQIDISNIQGFADVSSENSVITKKARAVGITEGTGRNEFSPNLPITRQDLCKMIYTMLLKLYPGLNNDVSKLSFSDSQSITSYAKEAVAFMSGNGIITGSENKFSPLSNASKEQAITIMLKVFEKKDNFNIQNINNTQNQEGNPSQQIEAIDNNKITESDYIKYLAFAQLAYNYNFSDGIYLGDTVFEKSKDGNEQPWEGSTAKWINFYKFANVEGWKVVQPYQKGSFAAVTFVSKDEKEVVIAYRGTDELFSLNSDAITDLKMKFNNLDDTYTQAINYYNEISTLITGKYNNANIVITGHSLGGALASYVSMAYGITAYTYSSPSVTKATIACFASKNLEDFDENFIGIDVPYFSEISNYGDVWVAQMGEDWDKGDIIDKTKIVEGKQEVSWNPHLLESLIQPKLVNGRYVFKLRDTIKEVSVKAPIGIERLESYNNRGIVGTSENDDIICGDFGTFVYSGDGVDKIVSGRYDDTLHGGRGNDLYIYKQDTGTDTIYDIEGSDDRIVLDSNIKKESVKVDKNSNPDFIIVKFKPEGSWFESGIKISKKYPVEYIQFGENQSNTINLQ